MKSSDALTVSLLAVEQLHLQVAGHHILHGMTFSISPAEILVVLGRNGAGKTSTLRSIMGLWPIRSGAIYWRGQLLSQTSTVQRARAGLRYVPENLGLFETLRVSENLQLARRQAQPDAARLDWILSLFPALAEFWHWPAGHLSGGQKQMLAIARALMEPCDLLLVDEPSKGLSPALIEPLARALRAVKSEGTALLLVEQNLSLAQRLGDRYLVLDQGQVVHQGKMDAFPHTRKEQAELLGLQPRGQSA